MKTRSAHSNINVTAIFSPKKFVREPELVKRSLLFLLIFVLLICLYSIGCSRPFYRQQADSEVYHLINAAPKDQRWELEDYTIDPKPQARFFDPHHPDCEPMPPDDPKAHRMMHSVYGMDNADWDSLGNTANVENPYWKQYLSSDEQGNLVLDRESAFQLALIHSPEYQTALENLYMSALDVSLQRFQFDTQFDSIHSVFYDTNGGSDNSNWTAVNGLDMSRMSASGGEYMVGIANSLTWTLAGQKPGGSGTVISMSILQPLLRGGGRAVVLEALTKSERDLLSNIRQMAFYRQGFYNTVVTGGRNVGMPVANGSPSGNSSTAGTGGYLSLLVQQREIDNRRSDVVSQRETQIQLLHFFQADRLTDRLQVEQAKGRYLRSLSQLLQQENSYNNSVDQFVMDTIGLPPDLNVQISDPMLDQFEIMSTRLQELQLGISTFLHDIRDEKRELPENAINILAEISSEIMAEIPGIKREIDTLDRTSAERIANLQYLQKILTSVGRQGDLEAYSVEEFISRVERVHYWMPIYEKNLLMIDQLVQILKQQDKNKIEQMLREGTIDRESHALLEQLGIASLLDDTKFTPEEEQLFNGDDPETAFQQEKFSDFYEPQPKRHPYRTYLIRVAKRLLQEVRFLATNQARTRLDTITMIPVDITDDTSLKIAALNRLDWMNERTKLVNSWRNIEVVANKLRGYLNLKVDGELGTPHHKPGDFSSKHSSLNVGLEFKAPLTRLAERNEYRVALLDYQRARRNYYHYVDQVNLDLREKLRRIQTAQLDFEVKRESLNVSISQVLVAQLKFDQPVPVGQKMGDNLARDLTDALSGLLDAQNDLINLWVNYYALRMSLCIDMGLMQLDDQGMWIDPGSIREEDYLRFAQPGDAGNLGPQTPEENPVFPRELNPPTEFEGVPGESNEQALPPVPVLSSQQKNNFIAVTNSRNVLPKRNVETSNHAGNTEGKKPIPLSLSNGENENPKNRPPQPTTVSRIEKASFTLSPSGRPLK